jgi:GT2 family glycosyltransferase
MGELLAIITLSRNVDYFSKLLDALSHQKGDPEYLGILVNNSNSAELTSLALNDKWATIDPGYNTSYAVGNNMAADAVCSKWYLFLNDDAVPDPTFLTKLWDARHSADVVGSLLLHDDGTVNHAGTMVSNTCLSDHIGRGAKKEDFNGFVYTPSVTFAAALVKGETFHKVGGLSTQYNYGYEDTDFCMKVIEAGGSVGCYRDAVATHGECGTRPRGGEADQHNAAQFVQTWKPRLGKVLTDYVERMHPEPVEGVLWQ